MNPGDNDLDADDRFEPPDEEDVLNVAAGMARATWETATVTAADLRQRRFGGSALGITGGLVGAIRPSKSPKRP